MEVTGAPQPGVEMEVTGASQPDVAEPRAINNEDSDAIQLAAPMVCEVSDSEPEVSEVSAINLAATSASQPSASSSLAGARGSDAGAPQPGMSPSNISPIVTEVLQFGWIPVEMKHPRTKEEREESAFADCLRKKKNIFLILTDFNSPRSQKSQKRRRKQLELQNSCGQ